MSSRYNQNMRRYLLLIVLLLMLLTGCRAEEDVPTTPVASPPPEPLPTITASTDPAITPEPITLRIWLPDWMIVEEPGATILQDSIQAFAAEQGIDVQVVIKSARGESGLLQSLEATYPVAPAVLPDLIALPFTEAETAALGDYLLPLGPLISADITADLYPFTQQVTVLDGIRYTIPFLSTFEHLAFQPSSLSEPPVNWNVILESQAGYAFPADGDESVLTDAVLTHYLSAVGRGGDANRNERALRQMLTFYDALEETGLVDESNLTTALPDRTWERAIPGEVPLAHTTSSLWLRDRGGTTALRSGPVPTADSEPRYIARGWTWAMITADPDRQVLVAQLVDRLMASETLAQWSQAAHYLPARRSALALWPNDSYVTFASEALEQAERPSPLTSDTTFVRAIHRAVVDVLSGASDVDTAARTAVDSW